MGIGRPQSAFVRLAEAGALPGILLDAGCGTGEHTVLAASYGARALGIDVSPLAIEIARRKAGERGIDTSFEVLDALLLDKLGQTFDTIVDSGLFHVFDDPARIQYVTAVHAALRPGGHLHLMCFSDRQPCDWGPRRVTEGELRAALAQAGGSNHSPPTASTSTRAWAHPPLKPGLWTSSGCRPNEGFY
jgi:SAM-dependent methyltransferase